MTISYEDFKKHAAVVIKSIQSVLKTHQKLKGIKHFPDGSAAVTDGYRLYLAKAVHDQTEEVVLSPTGKKLDIDYPNNLLRLIPNDDPKQTVFMNISELLHVAETIDGLGSLEDKTNGMVFKDNQISFLGLEVIFRHTFEYAQFDYPVTLNARFVADACKLFKAAGCTEVKLGFNGSMRPVTLEGSNVLALILPIKPI